jgi:type II secretory pathway component PulC
MQESPPPSLTPPAMVMPVVARAQAAEVDPSQIPSLPTVTVSRQVLDRELSDFTALAQTLSMSTEPRGGGFRLLSLQPGCFLEHVGLRAGDIVRKIDGRPLTSVADASAAYAWIRVTDHFSIEVVRNGRPLHLQLAVR